jgi:hypothetical protein
MGSTKGPKAIKRFVTACDCLAEPMLNEYQKLLLPILNCYWL